MITAPAWFPKIRANPRALASVRQLLDELGLHTVCEGALCPNRPECYANAHITVLILGDVCTRRCSFCAVSNGPARLVDPGEPARVAKAAGALRMRHVVVTSVTRDDLPDGGASQYVAVARKLRALDPAPAAEALIPDFQRDPEALRAVAFAPYSVLAHNVETVPRLYPTVRPGAQYERSLAVLQDLKGFSPEKQVKSGLMVGLGETHGEVSRVLAELRGCGVDAVTIGQYLRPSPRELPVERFVTPEEFADLAQEARTLGFRSVSAGSLVRSSYRAAQLLT